MVIYKNQCNKCSWSFGNIQDMISENEDIIRSNEEILNISKSSMLDPCGPNDDMWRKFSLPLTPPSSPRSYGESSESEESTDDSCDIAERLQDVSDNLDSTFEANDYNNFSDAINIRSKLISDCMWSGEEVRRLSYSSISPVKKQLPIEIEQDLIPTPCPSPPPPIVTTISDCPSSSECVDPTTVFPYSIQSGDSSSSGQSDSEEEIDVVTIDTKPLALIGTKRRRRSSMNVISTQKTSPILRRVMSEPIKLPPEKNISRKPALVYESDPENRRATHNVLERRRRIDLKKSFEKLRECVPNLENKEKSPKVVVLRRAANYIEILARQDFELEEQKRILGEEKQDLILRLKKLVKVRKMC